MAAEQGHLEIIKYLHENGADITVHNNSAIKWASCLGYVDIVKYLSQNGADLTAEQYCVLVWVSYIGATIYRSRIKLTPVLLYNKRPPVTHR